MSNPVDMINNPPHYKNANGVECIDWIEACLSPEEFKGYLRGCALKYQWRFKNKGHADEDLGKAIWYIRKLRDKLREIVFANDTEKPEEDLKITLQRGVNYDIDFETSGLSGTADEIIYVLRIYIHFGPVLHNVSTKKIIKAILRQEGIDPTRMIRWRESNDDPRGYDAVYHVTLTFTTATATDCVICKGDEPR